jgi:hypothetical protein
VHKKYVWIAFHLVWKDTNIHTFGSANQTAYWSSPETHCNDTDPGACIALAVAPKVE